VREKKLAIARPRRRFALRPDQPVIQRNVPGYRFSSRIQSVKFTDGSATVQAPRTSSSTVFTRTSGGGKRVITVGDVPTDHTSHRVPHTRATAHGHCRQGIVGCTLHYTLRASHAVLHTVMRAMALHSHHHRTNTTPNRSRRIYSSARRPRLLAVLRMTCSS
jgi:hypothetical protein